MGFTTAMKLRWKAWAPLLNAKSIECGLLLPIMLYCADELAMPLGHTYEEISYNLLQIIGAKLVDGENGQSGQFMSRNITWKGHEFLDDVGFIWEIAKAEVKAKLSLP
jgi:Hypothetical protein (DUF2513)